jgi:hypothetical protein
MFNQQEFVFGLTIALILVFLKSGLALVLPVAVSFAMDTLFLASMAEVVRRFIQWVDGKRVAARTSAFDMRLARTMPGTGKREEYKKF